MGLAFLSRELHRPSPLLTRAAQYKGRMVDLLSARGAIIYRILLLDVKKPFFAPDQEKVVFEDSYGDRVERPLTLFHDITLHEPKGIKGPGPLAIPTDSPTASRH